MITSRIIGKCISISQFGQKMRYGRTPIREWSLPVRTWARSVKSVAEGSSRTISPSSPRLWRCLFFCASQRCCLTPEQGKNPISGWHAVPPDRLQSRGELLTLWPAGNCSQRATAAVEEAGEVGNCKTQPSWPQEKLPAAGDAVCLLIPLHRDTVQTCVTCLRTQVAAQIASWLRAQSKCTLLLGWPVRYWPDSGESLCAVIGPVSFRPNLTCRDISTDVYIDFSETWVKALHVFWTSAPFVRISIKQSTLLASNWG